MVHKTGSFFRKVYKFKIFTVIITLIIRSISLSNLYDFSGNSSSSNSVTDTQNVLPSTSNHQDIQNIQVSYLTGDATNTPASVSPLVNGNEQHLSKQNIFKYLVY